MELKKIYIYEINDKTKETPKTKGNLTAVNDKQTNDPTSAPSTNRKTQGGNFPQKRPEGRGVGAVAP